MALPNVCVTRVCEHLDDIRDVLRLAACCTRTYAVLGARPPDGSDFWLQRLAAHRWLDRFDDASFTPACPISCVSKTTFGNGVYGDAHARAMVLSMEYDMICDMTPDSDDGSNTSTSSSDESSTSSSETIADSSSSSSSSGDSDDTSSES